jgi:hypothetical protein
LFVQIADERSLQAWQCYALFESKVDRDSDFETPVAVFTLQVELYVVTRGLPTVRCIEQPESVNSPFVYGMFGHLIVAVTEMETNLRRRGRSRGECTAFFRNGQSGGEQAQYENKDS